MTEGLIFSFRPDKFQAKISEYFYLGTALHDQGSSNLCHSFAIISCFRAALVNLFGNNRTTYQPVRNLKLGLSAKDLLEFPHSFEHSDSISSSVNYLSFETMLVEFIGGVNPRIGYFLFSH